MPTKRFLNVPAGSLLHYWVRVEPPGCANLNLAVTVNGVRNPPQVLVNGVNVAPPLTTLQIANLSPEPTFGPITGGGSLLLDLTIAFQAKGVVAVVPTLEEPGSGVPQTRPPLAFDGEAGQVGSAKVLVLA